MNPMGIASGAASLGSGLYGLFGDYNNPADAAMPYLNQIGNKTQQYYQPYFQAGKNQLPGLEGQYSNLLNDPGGRLNEIGQGYHQSPGFQFALQQALQGAGHAAAAGGMAGSPQHEQQNMGIATGLANQDYNNWLGQATGLYGQGLTGSQGLAGMGQQAGNNQANMIAQQLAQQANLAYQGEQNKNQNKTDAFGNIISGIGGLASGFAF